MTCNAFGCDASTLCTLQRHEHARAHDRPSRATSVIGPGPFLVVLGRHQHDMRPCTFVVTKNSVRLHATRSIESNPVLNVAAPIVVSLLLLCCNRRENDLEYMERTHAST